MVKSKKMSKSSIAVVVLSILLVLSMIMGITGAWFTDRVDFPDKQSQTLGFGRVDIEGAGASEIQYTIYEKTEGRDPNDYSQLIDGDKITIADNLNVVNNSNVDILYVVKKTLSVDVTPPQGLVLNSFTKEDVLSWLKKEGIALAERNETERGSLESDDPFPELNHSYNGIYVVDSNGAANAKAGTFKITVTAHVYAVQKGNLEVRDQNGDLDDNGTFNNIKEAFKATGMPEELMSEWDVAHTIVDFGYRGVM